jgi:hypothetical protein
MTIVAEQYDFAITLFLLEDQHGYQWSERAKLLDAFVAFSRRE